MGYGWAGVTKTCSVHVLMTHKQCPVGEGRVGGCYHGCPWEVEKEAQGVSVSLAWEAQSPGYTIKSLYLFGEGARVEAIRSVYPPPEERLR